MDSKLVFTENLIADPMEDDPFLNQTYRKKLQLPYIHLLATYASLAQLHWRSLMGKVEESRSLVDLIQ